MYISLSDSSRAASKLRVTAVRVTDGKGCVGGKCSNTQRKLCKSKMAITYVIQSVHVSCNIVFTFLYNLSGLPQQTLWVS